MLGLRARLRDRPAPRARGRAAAASPARRAAAPALACARRRGDGADARRRRRRASPAAPSRSCSSRGARACPAARRSATRSGRCSASSLVLARLARARPPRCSAPCTFATARRAAGACGRSTSPRSARWPRSALGLARGGLERRARRRAATRRCSCSCPGSSASSRRSPPAACSARRCAPPSGWRGTGRCRVRLALLALARAPSRTVATAAFLLVSLGLALFAAGYRSTLEQGARDEAAYAVPLDFTPHRGLPARSAARRRAARALRRASRPARASTRSCGGPRACPARARPSSARPCSALPAAALARLHWRSDFSAVSPAELARRLGADGPARLRGVRFRPGGDGVAAGADPRRRGPARPRRRGRASTASCSSRSAQKGPGRGSSAHRCRPACGRSSGSRSR